VDAELKVELVEPDADTEAVDELVRDLRVELLQLDVDSVSPVPAGPPPPGSKGVELAAAAALLVQVKGSVSVVTAVVSTIRSWLQRGKPPAGRTLKITLEGRTLELSAATAAQQDELVQEFLRAISTTEA
jgi:Effector Associated Constant Component 1